MQIPLLARAACVLVVAAGIPHAAGAAGNPEDPPPIAAWTAMAGYQGLSIRDIARSGPPVDASPVARDGSGPMILIGYRRARDNRLHRFEFATSSAAAFSYVSGVRAISLPSADGATRVEGRYEYRRYPFTDLGLRGLDVGAGVQAIADRTRLERHVPPAITIFDHAVRGGAAVVAAARLRRWRPLTLEAAWVNAAMIGGVTQRHSASAQTSGRNWGPGWSTDIELTALVQVATRIRLGAAYTRSGEGLIGTRPGITVARHAIAAGVVYGR